MHCSMNDKRLAVNRDGRQKRKCERCPKIIEHPWTYCYDCLQIVKKEREVEKENGTNKYKEPVRYKQQSPYRT